ncbi:MAG: FMN-binding protein [Bacteroidales bacterium]|nr:FMN-binding protein [Bacteroidales bacterium]MDD3666288.1 FMN-binding protein [Bacteroidales bacterium]
MMKRYIPIFVILTLSCLVKAQDFDDLSRQTAKRIRTEVVESFGSDIQYRIDRYEELSKGSKERPLLIIICVLRSDTIVGYIMPGIGYGRFDQFEYFVFYQPDFSIRKVVVSVYRSDHGLEITKNRWLKQLEKIGVSEPIIYGDNIDAVSGATLSGKSLIKGIESQRKYLMKAYEKEH